jgi:DNA-binding transcriptional regulator YiaG
MCVLAKGHGIIFLSPVGALAIRLSTADNPGGSDERFVNSAAAAETIKNDELTWIAGSVVLSDNPPQQLKFWRKKFGIKQADLAKRMAITPSVLSDYEKGRRPSPGANFIKRYLQALYDLASSQSSNSNNNSSSKPAATMPAAAVPPSAYAAAAPAPTPIAPDISPQ